MNTVADIDEKRITGVSDSDVTIPIRWSTNAKDLKWNNAIAMGVTIARTIDKMNLWDGYLHFKERVKPPSIRQQLVRTSQITEELILDVQEYIDLVFTEIVDTRIRPTRVYTSDISAVLPYSVNSTYREGDTVIYIVMDNPVYSDNIAANTGAFTVTGTFGGVMYTMQPEAVELSDHNTIKLTTSSFAQASGEVSVLYKAENGNIMRYLDAEKLNSFNTTFTYTTTYLEGE